jgi:hypothetical protein
MTGFSASDVPDIVKNAASGAVTGLKNISMSGFNSSTVTSSVESISKGITTSVNAIGSSIQGGGAVDVSASIQAIATGASNGANNISSVYSINSTTIASSVASGATSGGVSTNSSAVTSSVNSGANPEPFVPFASFADTNTTLSTISGKLIVGRSPNESSISSYIAYFGSDPTTNIGSSIASISKTSVSNANGALETTLSNVIVPSTAKFILIAFTRTDNTESSDYYVLPLFDLDSSKVIISGETSLQSVNGTYLVFQNFNEKKAYTLPPTNSNPYPTFLFWENGYWIVSKYLTLTPPNSANLTNTQKLSQTLLYVSSTSSSPPTQGWIKGAGGNSSASMVVQ